MAHLETEPLSKRHDLRPRARATIALRQWLRDGRFAVSEILPTEQMLCEQLSVSRGTVRAALRELETEGLVLSQKGPGRLRGRIAMPSSKSANNSLMNNAVVLITDVPKPMPHVKSGMLNAMESGVVTAVQETGMHLFVMHPESLTEADISRLIIDAPAGVVVGPAVADYVPYREQLPRICGRVPIVVAGNDALWSDCDRVISDHEAGASALTQWLVERGRKNIMRLWWAYPDSYWLNDRNRGFEKVMKNAGLTAMPPINMTNPRHTDAHDRAQFDENVRLVASHLIEYLVGAKPKIDAIVATSDSDAYLAAAACRLFGLRPNEDIWIAGYDNFSIYPPESGPGAFTPVATVDKQNHALGQKMVEILRLRTTAQLPADPQCILIKPELIVPHRNESMARQPEHASNE